MSFFISRAEHVDYKKIGHEFCLKYYNDIEFNGYASISQYYYTNAFISYMGTEYNNINTLTTELNNINVSHMSVNNISGTNQPFHDKHQILINTTGNFCLKKKDNTFIDLNGRNSFSDTFVITFDNQMQKWLISNHIFKQI
jgi:hypothetical protein